MHISRMQTKIVAIVVAALVVGEQLVLLGREGHAAAVDRLEPGLRVGHQPVVAGRTGERLAAFFWCP